jgi:hypothetical protein
VSSWQQPSSCSWSQLPVTYTLTLCACSVLPVLLCTLHPHPTQPTARGPLCQAGQQAQPHSPHRPCWPAVPRGPHPLGPQPSPTVTWWPCLPGCCCCRCSSCWQPHWTAHVSNAGPYGPPAPCILQPSDQPAGQPTLQHPLYWQPGGQHKRAGDSGAHGQPAGLQVWAVGGE